jgi:hypothetical protein
LPLVITRDWIKQRERLNASRNIGFVSTVSARASNIAIRSSLSGFFHYEGTSPQRVGKVALAVALGHDIDRIGRADVATRLQIVRPPVCQPVHRDNLRQIILTAKRPHALNRSRVSS